MLKKLTGPKAVAFIVVVAAMAIAAFVAVSRAQGPAQPPQPRVVVTITQLRPDMITTWDDLQKNEMIPAQKKAGLPWRHTLGNGISGQSFTRVTIGPFAKYAELDMPGGFITRAVSAEANANYNAKIRQTILSQHQSIATLQVNESIVNNSTTMLPFQIVQGASHIAIGYEYAHAARRIYLDGSPHPEGADFWMGDSRGRWEGDTLVVDVVGFNGKTWLGGNLGNRPPGDTGGGTITSDSLHVVERWRLVDADTLEFYCALARQCFINEYVWITTPEELGRVREVERVRASVVCDLARRQRDRQREGPRARPAASTVAARGPGTDRLRRREAGSATRDRRVAGWPRCADALTRRYRHAREVARGRAD